LAIAYNNRGVALAAQDPNRAISDFTEAINHDPRFVLAYVNRGRAHLAKGEFDQAISDENEAVRLTEASQNDSKTAYPYVKRGEAYLAIGKFELALADFSTAVAISSAIDQDKRDPDAYSYRGYTRFLLGDFASAKSELAEALKLQTGPIPLYGSIWRRRGLTMTVPVKI
jgi:tetratricopeptide (TPR) repeat protein